MLREIQTSDLRCSTVATQFTSAAQTSHRAADSTTAAGGQSPPGSLDPGPAPKPEDVKSTDSILAAVYSVISGPAGDRDWNRFRSCFCPAPRSPLPERTAKAIFTFARAPSSNMSPAPAVTLRSMVFSKVRSSAVSDVWQHRPDPLQLRIPERRRGSAYRPRHQQFSAGLRWQRWWIVSILWDEERPDNPIPKEFAARP